MGKVRSDIRIGQRMREESERLFPTCAQAATALRCDRKNFTAWLNGETPSAIFWPGYIMPGAM